MFQACCNVYAMRTLLKTLVPKPQEHSEAIGFGCVDISVIFQAFDPLIKPLVTSAAKKTHSQYNPEILQWRVLILLAFYYNSTEGKNTTTIKLHQYCTITNINF